MWRSPPFTPVVFFSPSLPPSPRAVVSPPAVRSRGAVRLIRARVQRETRWAFVRSTLSYSNSRAQGQGRTARPHAAAGWLLQRERRWNERDPIRYRFHSSMSCTLHTFYVIYMFTSSFLRFCYYDLYLSHARCVMFSRAPVVYSGLFASLWFYLSKRITFGFCYFMPPSSLVLLLRHFPLFEPLLCHQGATLHFIPHPLVRISAALLWVSVGEYRSLWVYGLQCHLCLQ